MRWFLGTALAVAIGLLQVRLALGGPGGQPSRQQWTSPPPLTIDGAKRYSATLQTTAGDIGIELLVGDAPMTVNNFVFLAREGYYAGTPFHRVIQGFMIQGGDPTGTGTGGPGYRFDDEPVRRAYEPGIVAMANAGPNTNGSQFFICHGENARTLPPNYTIFGRVTSGMDVVDAIATAPVQSSPRGERSVPVEPVRINSVTIQEQ
jgi:cyclophilin family peptidyl-prolyl cis-trans isomerase